MIKRKNVIIKGKLVIKQEFLKRQKIIKNINKYYIKNSIKL